MRTDRLKECREKAGLTQRDLSRACGIASNMIHRYENGLSDPSAKVLTLIAEQLHVSTDYLVGLTDNPTSRPDEPGLNPDEQDMIEIFRDQGWPGVFRLGAERITR